MQGISKTLCLWLLSAPIFLSANFLANSINSYPDQADLLLSNEDMPKQGHKERTNSFY